MTRGAGIDTAPARSRPRSDCHLFGPSRPCLGMVTTTVKATDGLAGVVAGALLLLAVSACSTGSPPLTSEAAAASVAPSLHGRPPCPYGPQRAGTCLGVLPAG